MFSGMTEYVYDIRAKKNSGSVARHDDPVQFLFASEQTWKISNDQHFLSTISILQVMKIILDICSTFCHLPTEPAPNFNSLSNCSPDNVPSIASQFSLNTE